MHKLIELNWPWLVRLARGTQKGLTAISAGTNLN